MKQSTNSLLGYEDLWLGVDARTVGEMVPNTAGTVDTRVSVAIAWADKAIELVTPDTRSPSGARNVIDEIGRWRGRGNENADTLAIVRHKDCDEIWSNLNGVVRIEYATRINETFVKLLHFLGLIRAGHVDDSFSVFPIQAQGRNIFRIDKRGKQPGDTDGFFVKVHFYLKTKYDLDIINVNLSYSLETAMPGSQKICINETGGVYEETDDSYRMISPRKANRGDVVNIFVSRRFICPFTHADHADYGTVTIDLELSSPDWQGIRMLSVKGKLEPAGMLNVHDVLLHDAS